jgi:hypothetical protein
MTATVPGSMICRTKRFYTMNLQILLVGDDPILLKTRARSLEPLETTARMEFGNSPFQRS